MKYTARREVHPTATPQVTGIGIFRGTERAPIAFVPVNEEITEFVAGNIASDLVTLLNLYGS